MSVTLKSQAVKVIRTLERSGFWAVCPCCNEPFRLSNCGLFYLDDFTDEGERVYQEWQSELRQRAADLKDKRKSIKQTSEVVARATNVGSILERLAPALDSFPFNRNDCRSLFDPIDYIIFDGMTARGEVSTIHFADIKTGNADLRPTQRQIRRLVEGGKVTFDRYETEPRD